MIGESPDLAGRAAFAPAVLFRGLSEAARLALLRRLAAGEARAVDLIANLPMPGSTVSTHRGCLRDCGLVDVHAHGRAPVHYLGQPEWPDLLAAAETPLAASGNAVALRAGHGDAGPKPRPDTAHPSSRPEESTR